MSGNTSDEARFALIEQQHVILQQQQVDIRNDLKTLDERTTRVKADAEKSLSAALDRMTFQLLQQSAEHKAAMENYTDSITKLVENVTFSVDTALKEVIRKRVIKITGTALKWGERGAWLLVIALGKTLWEHAVKSLGLF